MTVAFSLPKPRPPTDDAKSRLERLYREVGTSAVASALVDPALKSAEERALAALFDDEPAQSAGKKTIAA